MASAEVFADYQATFAQEWEQAEDPEARERARRSCIIAFVEGARALALESGYIDPNAIVTSGLWVSRVLGPWERRARLVCASVQVPHREPLPTSEELLESFKQQDGRFSYDLSVPVP